MHKLGAYVVGYVEVVLVHHHLRTVADATISTATIVTEMIQGFEIFGY